MALTPVTATLPTCMAVGLECAPAGARWLVRDLWTSQGVGFIGGAPKNCKSWLGLDFAVSIASNTPCLGHFAVDEPGNTLVYLAEDTLPAIRERIAGICLHRHLDLAALDLHVITASALRLDLDADQQRLDNTLAWLRPKLLLLDPLVRLHAADENSSADISPLLGFLRILQRQHHVAIALVHHLGKKHRAQLGQALRGSGDLHAWSDDNLFLTRDGDRLQLTTEHRAAPAPKPFAVRLVTHADGTAPHLEMDHTPATNAPSSPASLADRIRHTLRLADAPLTRAALRTALRVNNNALGHTLVALERQGAVRHTSDGWSLSQ